MIVSVLIDLQNLFRACSESLPLDAVIGEIISRALRQGEIQEVRLFVPNYQSIAPWQAVNALQRKYGVEISVCLTLREGAKGETLKDAVDLEFLKWIVNHIHKDVGPELLVFVTGDSHFVVPANEARKRGKKVEFWFIDGGAGGVIRRQEDTRSIKLAPPKSEPSGENLFYAAVSKLHNQEPLDDDDKIRLQTLARTAETDIKESAGQWPLTDELLNVLGRKWNVSPDESQQIVEALMVLGIARVYPAIAATISIDKSSPFFQWISALDFE